jgi:hypothetical protein
MRLSLYTAQVTAATPAGFDKISFRPAIPASTLRYPVKTQTQTG